MDVRIQQLIVSLDQATAEDQKRDMEAASQSERHPFSTLAGRAALAAADATDREARLVAEFKLNLDLARE